MVRLDINNKLPEREIIKLAEVEYDKHSNFKRERDVIVQCGNCGDYWVVDTWTEVVPCLELTPTYDVVEWCDKCRENALSLKVAA